MAFNDAQPRVPAGRHDGGQFRADKGDEITDLTSTFGDDNFINQIVAAGAEAYVKGITPERVRAYLGTVGRDDVLSNQEAARRLTPWSGLRDDGEPVKKKEAWLTGERYALVEEAPDQPHRYRFTEEGRQAALHNLLLEAKDRKRFEAKSLSFSDAAADACADFYVAERVAEATRNLGKPGRETFDLLATGLMSGGVEDFLTRRVPDDVKEYGAFARLGSAFEGTGKVGSDFLRYEPALPERTAEAKDALWDACARRRMEERLPDAWDAARPGIKAKFGVEPDDYEAFFRPKHCLTPLEYEPAEEDWEAYRALRAKAKAGDVRAQATMAAFDAAVKNAGRHDSTLLSDGRASTPFAKNRGSRKIEVPYRIHGVGVEGVRRGSLFVYSFTNGREYFEAGLTQFRSTLPVSLNKKTNSDENAAELVDLLANSRSGNLYNERAAADPAEIYGAGQRYTSAAAIAKALPDDEENNIKLRDLLGIDPHDGITDMRARAMAIAKDITDARAEGVPEGVIRRLWGDSLAEAANKAAERKIAQVARVKAMNAAIQRRLHDRAAQRKAAAAQAR
ncbi:hypothetical protein [Bifidobacterium bifidum]|uniref:hypothetical protein n=1 Tax=Bifidobacterium bifidum TaxID=1681 RepID=UPI0022E5589D|nr:hypothetical protein [Bifidobacterium bifidum]